MLIVHSICSQQCSSSGSPPLVHSLYTPYSVEAPATGTIWMQTASANQVHTLIQTRCPDCRSHSSVIIYWNAYFSVCNVLSVISNSVTFQLFHFNHCLCVYCTNTACVHPTDSLIYTVWDQSVISVCSIMIIHRALVIHHMRSHHDQSQHSAADWLSQQSFECSFPTFHSLNVCCHQSCSCFPLYLNSLAGYSSMAAATKPSLDNYVKLDKIGEGGR